MELPSWLLDHRHVIDHVPFLSMMVGQRTADRPLLTRSLENLVTAAIAAGFVMWANDKVQDVKIEAVQVALRETRAETRAEIAELRTAVASLHLAIIHHDAKR